MLIRESELMSSQELILTIDIGTSSCKVCLFDLSGAIRATAKSEYPTLSPQPSFAEQDVSAIYSGIVQSVKAVLSKHSPSRVIALACDTMLHSTLLLDEEGDPLYPLLNWMDTRCQDELKSLNQEYQEKRFYFRNGVPLHTIYNLPRLIWFRKHYPSFLQSAWKIVTIKDWFLGKITGEWYCDYSTASGTGLLNLFDRRWDEELVSCAQVSTKQFLPLCEPDHHFPLQVGPFTHDTGLLPGIPVVWGGGDGPFANLGEGMFHQREMVITVGSSGAVRMCDHQP
ncbi:MAG TPA: FGGY family carbohydrate kinase, partial [Atribacter sp.]